jgi:hypothetical protein
MGELLGVHLCLKVWYSGRTATHRPFSRASSPSRLSKNVTPTPPNAASR